MIFGFITIIKISEDIMLPKYMVDYIDAITTLACWLVGCFFINVDLAIFQPYLDLEAGDNQSLKIQVARRGIEPRSSCSASQELNHSATAAPYTSLYLKPKSDCADLARQFATTWNFAKIGEVGVEMFPTCHPDDLVPT